MNRRLSDDCFALPPGVSWTPVDTALARLQEKLSCLVGTEEVCVSDAGGRVLARPAIALRDNPPAANAAVDGYAFAWASLQGRDAEDLPLEPGRAAAGHPFKGAVPDGHAVRILTGAEIPRGADTVVLQEDCTIGGGRVRFTPPRKQGANCRGRGEDAKSGDIALAPGRRLGPGELARLASVGIATVTVRSPLRVAILSTGDELLQPGASPNAPGIFDANRPMLHAMVRDFGHTPVDLGAAPDNRDHIRTLLDTAKDVADVVVTTGGASAGDEDHVSRLLRDEGTISTWRIAVKPGRPLAMGLWDRMPIFGLPGNPVAAFVCGLIFLRPALARLAGADWPEPVGFTVPGAFEKSKKAGRREYLRARLTANGSAEIFHSEGSGLIGGLSWSEGLVELPDTAMSIVPGDSVRFLPYSAFGLSR